MLNVQNYARIRCYLAFISITILFLFYSPRPVLACTPPPGYPNYTAGDHARAAPIVLEGTVVAAHYVDHNYRIATVDIHYYFKGDAASRVTVSNWDRVHSVWPVWRLVSGRFSLPRKI